MPRSRTIQGWKSLRLSTHVDPTSDTDTSRYVAGPYIETQRELNDLSPQVAPILDTRQKTLAQLNIPSVIFARDLAYLQNTLPQNYDTYRRIYQEGLINWAIKLVIATLTSLDWGVVATDDATAEEEVALIKSNFLSLRRRIISIAVRDFYLRGWAGFEKLFGVSETGDWIIRDLKELLADKTQAMINPYSGAFAGVRQLNWTYQPYVQIDARYICWMSWDQEGDYHYGNCILEGARQTYNDWIDTRRAANQYDIRVACPIMQITYPPGMSSDGDGNNVPNSQIAEQIAQQAKAGYAVIHPTVDLTMLNGLQQGQDPQVAKFDFKYIQDASNRQVDFVNRAKYLDARLLECCYVPARMAIEGMVSTLGSSEGKSHKDTGVTMWSYMDKCITETINQQCVDQILVMNFGPSSRGHVRLVEPNIAEVGRAFKEAMAAGYAQELKEVVDVKQLAASVDLPIRIELAGEMATDTAFPKAQQSAIAPERVDVTTPPLPDAAARVGLANTPQEIGGTR